MPSQKLEFPGAHGATLAGRLDLPAGPPRAYALFAHCFTCSKEIFAAARVSAALAEQGIAVLRFDFTGLGSSEGEFANTNFSSNVEDLVAAADFLRSAHAAPQVLIGHSLGGAAVLAAAERIPEAAALATINAPCDPEHVTHLIRGDREAIERQGEAEVTIGGRSFRIGRQFLEDLSEQRMRERIAGLRRPLMILHAPRDAVVGVDNARRIFEAARHPKSFVALDGADHLLSRREDAAFVARMLGAWAPRYVGEPPREAPEATAPVADASEAGVVTVAESGEGRLGQTIHDGRHQWAADEPEASGGRDTGPSPYELLLSALGACTAMTLRLYADRKRWPLDKVTVRLKHRKIHARDCEECETREGRLDEMERLVYIEGALDDEQRARLIEIANKCPVHRTLHGEIREITREVDREGRPVT